MGRNPRPSSEAWREAATRLVMQGAREHGLPQDYIDQLARFDTMADADQGRARRNRQLLD